jgi:hypothetical protein
MAHAGTSATGLLARKSVRSAGSHTISHGITAFVLVLSVSLSLVGALGCGGGGPERASSPAFLSLPLDRQPLEVVTRELEAMSGELLGSHKDTFRGILADTIDKDAYLCMPSPRALFFGDTPEGQRVIQGVMPHYGFFFGPMSYLVRRRAGQFEVRVRVAVDPPDEGAALELPDCGLEAALGRGGEGTPYPLSGKLDACPRSGSFRAKATPRAVRALLARWSTEAEGYWNRDAALVGLPVTYDFDFVLAEEARARSLRVDMEAPLSPTCGRTPYFSAMRAGWSLPIVAHEVGHVMGLLDEYEMFSGIVSFYPKTPFEGAEVSRMGISMKEETRVLPLHHYLIVRRYVCPEPKTRQPYPTVL